jgi:hypothetical protein
VTNFGPRNKFALNSKQRLYLGGLPLEKGSKALAKFHLKDSKSLEGCISDVYINGESVNLDANSVEKQDTQVGCTDIIDLCSGIECGPNSKCITNSTLIEGFQCEKSELIY